MKRKTIAFKSIQDWSFIFLILFFILSFIDRRFGILGLVCLSIPLVLSLLGYGRVHCSHICPRGSFFGKVVKFISIGHKLPSYFRSQEFKVGLLIFMIICMTGNVLRFFPDWIAMANGMFQIMTGSLIIGIVFGIIFKPRSWCTFCPIGYASGLIKYPKQTEK